jgi:copper homeostasis protein (lipoprotein)
MVESCLGTSTTLYRLIFQLRFNDKNYMKTIKRQIKLTPALLLIFLAFLACNPVSAETPSDENATHTQKKLNLSGLYLGFFPCEDCHGIKTTLALNKSGTYAVYTIYVGKSDREFVEKGRYVVDAAGDKIILTPKKGSTTEQQYLIDDDMLIKLDENGERITSDGADRYILHRKDVVSSPQEHSGH